jgi:hypothetical protein
MSRARDMANSTGRILQTQYYTNNSNTSGTNNGWADVSSGLRLNFTPKSANSKILVHCSFNWLVEGSHRQVVRMLKDSSTQIGTDWHFSMAITGWTTTNMAFHWEDTTAHTPGTQLTYSFQTAVSSQTWYYNYNFAGANGVSSFVIQEVSL